MSQAVELIITTANKRPFRIRLRSRQDPVAALDKLLGINKIKSTAIKNLVVFCRQDGLAEHPFQSKLKMQNQQNLGIVSSMGCRMAYVAVKILRFVIFS